MNHNILKEKVIEFKVLILTLQTTHIGNDSEVTV